jgi:hypothetical protein
VPRSGYEISFASLRKKLSRVASMPITASRGDALPAASGARLPYSRKNEDGEDQDSHA